MNADHLPFQRATSVSIIGLVIQLLLGLTLLLYGIFGEDPGARSGAFVVFYGVPVWLALALVFHQHKRERLEARENELYRSSPASSGSVFGDDAIGESIQANKLAWMHRYFLPGVSLALAGAYLATGLLRFGPDLESHARPNLEGTFDLPTHAGVAISVGVSLLILGFILARFVAGMAKQKVWSLLHAGAAAAVSTMLVGALLVVSHALELGSVTNTGLRFMPVIVDGFMVFLGAEIVLNFVLTIYRPRKPGEYLRPAFDSRLLAFLAAPDRLAESVSDAINYQLGFDISSTWFYRLVSRSLIGLGTLAALSLWLTTSFTVVQANEQGLLLSNDGTVRELESGLVVKMPWPFSRVETYPAEQIESMRIGLETTREDASRPLLWTDPDPTQGRFLMTQADATSTESRAAGDTALSVGEVPIQYTITSLRSYMGLAQDGPRGEPEKMRQEVLEFTASAVVARFFLAHSIDELVGPRRPELETELRDEIQRAFDGLYTLDGTGAGVRVHFVGLQGLRPPSSVARAYEKVDAAWYQRQSEIESGRGERIKELSQATGDVDLAARVVESLEVYNDLRERIGPDASGEERVEIERAEQSVQELLEQAGGNAATLVIQARGERWSRHMRERRRAKLSEGQTLAFSASPLGYTSQLMVRAIHDSTQEARIWISPLPISVELDQTELNADVGGIDSIIESQTDAEQE